jgi:hypothetical protein
VEVRREKIEVRNFVIKTRRLQREMLPEQNAFSVIIINYCRIELICVLFFISQTGIWGTCRCCS